ncbi:MAG TPA: PAS domain-containing protein [Enterovirga sp.]
MRSRRVPPTGRKSEVALSDIEERYRALIAANAGIVWRADPDGAILDGCGWHDLTGLFPEGTQGHGWLSSIHPADRPQVAASWAEMVRSGEPGQLEYRLRTRDDTYRWVLAKAVPLKTSDGAIREWVGTVTDVHDRKRAEDALQARERRYRALVQASSSLFWSAEPGGSVLEVDGWEKFTGAPAAAAERDGWLAFVHPDDLARITAETKNALSALRPFHVEYRLRHVSGAYRWVSATGVPIRNAQGGVDEWAGALADTHEARASKEMIRAAEERLRLAADATGLGIWDFDFVADERRWSNEMRAILGLREADPVSREIFFAHVHADDRASAEGRFDAALEVGSGGRFEAEFRIWRGDDGAERWVIIYGQVYFGPNGRPVRMLGTVKDTTEHKIATEALRRSEERLRLAAESTGLGIWQLDLKTGEREWSPELRGILGIATEAEITYDGFISRIHPDDRPFVNAHFAKDFPANGAARCEFRVVTPDGEVRWVVTSGRRLLDRRGQPSRAIGTMQDVTAWKRSEAALRASEERLRLALQAGRMFAWERKSDGDYVTRSASAEELIGLKSGPASEFANRLHPDDRERAASVLAGSWGADCDRNELRFVRPDGKVLWLAARSAEIDEAGKQKRIVGVTFDITERKSAEAEVWRLANDDALTGLPNRRWFQCEFERALRKAEHDGTGLGLLLIDLDDFKDVNDTLGHDAGDALLKEAGQRLSAFLRDGDFAARLGGDEFAMIVAASLDNAVLLAEHVADALRQPFSYEGHLLTPRGSIGVAACPDHHATVAELLKDADFALYAAKLRGKNRILAYTPEMRAGTERRLAALKEVRAALSNNEIVPFYQPKTCLRSGSIVGFEALARWQHPTRGLLTPGAFAAAFEDPEISQGIGKAMVRQVAADVHAWTRDGVDCGRVAVNLSPADFAEPDLADTILAMLDEAGVAMTNFEIEVTENVFLGASSALVLHTLERFKERGVTIALDDFGTGFASLTHLKQFPVDHLKIDQTFIRGLAENTDDQAIVSAVIGLAKSLHLSVTAEGVETREQAALLHAKGCDFGQGYLFAKPMVGSRVPWFVRSSGDARVRTGRAGIR